MRNEPFAGQGRAPWLVWSLITILCGASPALAHEDDDDDAAAANRLTAPVLIERVEPAYPEKARSASVGGVVGLELSVSADGKVTEVKVLRRAGFGFDQAAAEAARRFLFRPATKGGKPIAATVLFDQQFILRAHLSAETSAEPAPEAAAPVPLPVEAEATTPAYESTVQSHEAFTAASASMIRNQDFDLRPKTSPNDILRVVPGLMAVQHQGGGKGDQLFLRGFDADHGTDVAILVDGVPVNLPSHAHGQGFVDLHWIIPEAIQQIEVVKGPYDARYGDFATAGAVNLVTRDRFESSSVQFTLGGFPTRGCSDLPGSCALVAQQRFVGIAAPKLTGWAAKLRPWLALEVARDDGPFKVDQNLNRYNLFGKVSYDLTPSTVVGAFLSVYGAGWTSSGQIPSREVDARRLSHFGAIDPSEGGLTQRQSVNAFLRHRDPRHEFNATVYYTRYRLALWNNFTFFLRNPTLGDEIEQDDARSIVGGNLSYHFHHRWRGMSFRTSLGAQARYDTAHLDLWSATSQQGNYRKRLDRFVDPSQFSFGNNTNVDVLNLSGYAQEDVTFNHHVRALVALRADYFGFAVDDKGETLGAGNPSSSGSSQRVLLSPKATVVVTPWRHHLDLFLNFGMGFHSNDARIAVQDARTTSSGAVVNTVPRIYAGELGARFSPIQRLSIGAALWASYLENETLFSGDGAIFEPSDPTRRFGVDADLRLEILRWLYLDYDIAYANATTVPPSGPGAALALAPRLYMTGGLMVKHPVGVRGGLRFRYLGPRPAFNEDSVEYQTYNATQPRRVNTEGFFVVDLYGAYRWRSLEVSLAIQNLLNATWREAQFGNNSCTRDEVSNPSSASYAACGATLPVAQRIGVPDVHYTPGVPFNLQLTAKVFF